MKWQIENEDGMYPVKTVLLNEVTEEECGELLRSFATPDFNSQLANILDYVKEIQEYYRTNKPVNHTEKEILSDARHIESMITQELPGILARGAIDAALRVAFNIGGITEKIHALGFEKYVKQVKTNTKKLQDGFKTSGIGHSKEEIQKALELYPEMLKQYPGQKMLAQKKVREKTGIPERTLREYLKKSLADL